MKLLHAFTIGKMYNSNNLTEMIAELIKPTTVRHRIESQLVFIEVTNVLSVESVLNIQTDVSFRHDASSIFDYFQSYQSSPNHPSAPFYKYVAHKDGYEVHFVPLKPSANYQDKLRQFNKVVVDYILVSTTAVITRYYSDSTCSLHHLSTSTDNRTSFFLHTSEYDIKDGIIDYRTELLKITGMKYPQGRLPFSNMVQIRLTFKGPYDDGTEDDAVVLLKSFYSITSVEEDDMVSSSWMTIVGVLLVLCIAIFIYRMYRRCKKLEEASKKQQYDKPATSEPTSTELPDTSVEPRPDSVQPENKLEISDDTF
jgi:hypothetical protein